MNNRQIIGFMGAFILILGGFSPVMPLSRYEQSCYFESTDTLIIFVIVVPVVCGLLIYYKKFPFLKVISILLVISNLLVFIDGVGSMLMAKSRMKNEVDDNPFEGLGHILQGVSTHIQWGWLLLLGGSLLLFYSSFKREEKNE